MIPSIHNPQTSSTPSERLFAERARQRRERMAHAAKLFDALPPKSRARDFSPTAEIVKLPETVEQWTERQKQIFPPMKKPWFRIVDDLGPVEPVKPSVEQIQYTVARYYGIHRAELISAQRAKRLVRPRQVAMYLCKELTVRSYLVIGRRFGQRDHSTILYSHQKVERLIPTDVQMATDIETLKGLLGGGA